MRFLASSAVFTLISTLLAIMIHDWTGVWLQWWQGGVMATTIGVAHLLILALMD